MFVTLTLTPCCLLTFENDSGWTTFISEKNAGFARPWTGTEVKLVFSFEKVTTRISFETRATREWPLEESWRWFGCRTHAIMPSFQTSLFTNVPVHLEQLGRIQQNQPCWTVTLWDFRNKQILSWTGASSFFWMIHYVTCVPSWLTLYHVTGSMLGKKRA